RDSRPLVVDERVLHLGQLTVRQRPGDAANRRRLDASAGRLAPGRTARAFLDEKGVRVLDAARRGPHASDRHLGGTVWLVGPVDEPWVRAVRRERHVAV